MGEHVFLELVQAFNKNFAVLSGNISRVFERNEISQALLLIWAGKDI